MSVSLLDIREGRKVSADFHVDLNHEVVRQMLSTSGNLGDQGLDGGNCSPQENGLTSSVEKKTEDCQLSQDLENWLRFPKQVAIQVPFGYTVGIYMFTARVTWFRAMFMCLCGLHG